VQGINNNSAIQLKVDTSSTGVSAKDTPVLRWFLRFPDTWQLATTAIALLVLIPILILMASLFTPDREV